jgi:hypothetical protein
MSITQQLIYLFVLAIPVASIAWTITHEEVIREFRETCQARAQNVGACISESSSICSLVSIASVTMSL